MNNQEQDLLKETNLSEQSENKTTIENQSLKNDENENTSSVVVESKISNDSNQQQTTHRTTTMSQDIRYSTEQSDREKLIEKYTNYQVSDTNSCHVRFLIDHRQKKILFGRDEEDHSVLQSIAKTFNVNLLPGYQNPTKLSLKLFGTEANVRKCLIEIMNRIFKQTNQSTIENDTDNHNQETTPNVEKSQETEPFIGEHFVGKILNAFSGFFTSKLDDEKSSSHSTSANNPDLIVTEEKIPETSSTSNTNEEKNEKNIEREQFKFVPYERKPEYVFPILITNQGQEVLKKNWNVFAGSLQQRLNVTVTNPFKLPKFGDKQWQNELSITGELYENIIDAVLQLTAFINDVLGISIQTYKSNEEQTSGDNNNYQAVKNNNSNNDYHQQRRYEYNNNNNNNYRQSPSQHQGQSPSCNTYHDRTFFNRGRNGIYEQIVLIRSNCVARIVGTRGSNLRRIQSKCHLRDMIVARQPNENGYVECTLSAYQTRNLNFAIDTIRSYLRNEDDQAIQVLDSNYIDNPSQSSSSSVSFQHSPQHDQPRLSASNQDSQQQQTKTRHSNRETSFMTRPLHLGNGNQLPHPSYNFQNTPSFDFTHRPTSASRKTDKRPGEVNDFNNTNNGQTRTQNDYQCQQYGGSSSSNSSSVSPRHKSKRTCPETKEIDCTTDDGFWIQKQYYHALDETSKELFDSLLDKLEKIRIANEENAARKQLRLIGRNRPNKSRGFPSTTHSYDEKDLKIKSTQDEHENKIEESTNVDEHKEKDDLNSNTVVVVEQN